MPMARILLVDDNENVRHTLQQVLEQNDFEVVAVACRMALTTVSPSPGPGHMQVGEQYVRTALRPCTMLATVSVTLAVEWVRLTSFRRITSSNSGMLRGFTRISSALHKNRGRRRLHLGIATKNQRYRLRIRVGSQ